MAESVVQVSPPGGGPNVRVVSVVATEPDGSQPTTVMQVVVQALPDGTLVDQVWDRGARRMAESARLADMDAFSAGLRSRGYERVTSIDRRGNLERGMSR